MAEGPRYRIGSFEVTGSKHFSSEDLARFYPFGDQPTTLGGAVKSVLRVGRGGDDREYFDQAAWDDATRRVGEAYANEGYIYANVRPVVERTQGRRRLRADGESAVGGRREDAGDREPRRDPRQRHHERVVHPEPDLRRSGRRVPPRRAAAQLPGHRQPRASSRRRFRAPDTKPANDQGDVDIIFHVKEKRTGNVNFGASVGQGAGVGGFIGFDQPNLFGMCKKGSLNWQFGQYINDFSLTYSDPFIKESQISGNGHGLSLADALLHPRRRSPDADRRTAADRLPALRLAVLAPVRVVRRGAGELRRRRAGEPDQLRRRHVRALDVRPQRSITTRASGFRSRRSGGHQLVSAQFNGLFGGAKYNRYTAEVRHYATLAQFGGGALGTDPITLALGLSARRRRGVRRSGRVLHLAEVLARRRAVRRAAARLRGVLDHAAGLHLRRRRRRRRSRSRSAARSTANSVELGLRINQQIYLDAFYDAGNIWARPQDFNPTRLFRGVGFGGSIVTPAGTARHRLGVWTRSYRERRAEARNGKCTSSSDSSSNLEFSCVRSFARRLSRSPSSLPWSLPARAQGAEGGVRPDRRPARPGAGPRRGRGAVREGDRDATATRSSG